MLFRFFFSWLYKNPTVGSISKRSDKIFNVFTKTQKDCDSLNAEIAKVVSSKEELVKAIQEEINDLNAVKTKNANLSSKISSFLNS